MRGQDPGQGLEHILSQVAHLGFSLPGDEWIRMVEALEPFLEFSFRLPARAEDRVR
jgi:hypothetical protein